MLTDTAKPKRRSHPHDFRQSLSEWEESVFIASDHFVLSPRLGVGEYQRVEVASWPEVKTHLSGMPQPDRVFVYAVTVAGRSTLLNGDRMRNGRWDQLWRSR
jgi:hypothetical protein